MENSWKWVLCLLKWMGVLSGCELLTTITFQLVLLFVDLSTASTYLQVMFVLNSIPSIALIIMICFLKFCAFNAAWEPIDVGLSRAEREKVTTNRIKNYNWWFWYALSVWAVVFSINLTSLLTLLFIKGKLSPNFAGLLVYHEFALGFVLVLTFSYSFYITDLIYYSITIAIN